MIGALVVFFFFIFIAGLTGIIDSAYDYSERIEETSSSWTNDIL